MSRGSPVSRRRRRTHSAEPKIPARSPKVSYQNILFEVADGIARLTLNRPDRLNSFNTAMHAEGREAPDSIEDGAHARGLFITGAGRGFCPGPDLCDRAVSPRRTAG